MALKRRKFSNENCCSNLIRFYKQEIRIYSKCDDHYCLSLGKCVYLSNQNFLYISLLVWVLKIIYIYSISKRIIYIYIQLSLVIQLPSWLFVNGADGGGLIAIVNCQIERPLVGLGYFALDIESVAWSEC